MTEHMNIKLNDFQIICRVFFKEQTDVNLYIHTHTHKKKS